MMNNNRIFELMADTLYDIGYCQDWAYIPNKQDDGEHIVFCDVVGEELGECIPFVPYYDGENRNALQLAVKQLTTLEQFLIRHHFDLWLKYSHPAYFGEDEDLFSIVQQVVYAAFEELYNKGNTNEQ